MEIMMEIMNIVNIHIDGDYEHCKHTDHNEFYLDMDKNYIHVFCIFINLLIRSRAYAYVYYC